MLDFGYAGSYKTRQKATGNRQQATGKRQQATGNRQKAKGKRQKAKMNCENFGSLLPTPYSLQKNP
ncbi:MAG: hypothetical protein F6J90_03185 [Moorea sp. SIOASIH]|uniref:hypothetical protein n=1 Tax=Moorena sp. SIOASIH TaxID=2607817 RepID=UPI0013B98F64|nr:hypothetical protein [Moorena sp. SIOASIH]NEO35361.1 hypothetical protein [Moorena sp. SIOASIH]